MDKSVSLSLKMTWTLVLLVVTISVYWPGLNGALVFDSRTNIESNTALHLDSLDWKSLRAAALSNHSGPTGRPIPTASFALNHITSGLNPFAFKLVNLIIHCINGVLIFFLTLRLLEAHQKQRGADFGFEKLQWIALSVTALWLLHPINLTNVLYVVQRMNSLSALFVLCGMLAYTTGRLKSLDGNFRLFQTLFLPTLFTALATFSKENGALLPAYLLIIETLFFKFRGNSRAARPALYTYYGVMLVTPTILATAFLYSNTDWLQAAYSVRDFTLTERLLTESRVIWLYIGLILIPNSASYGLFHDYITTSGGLLDPISTLPAAVAIFLSIVAAILFHRKSPILSFGILLFFASHLVESTVYPLEIAYEHRNYIGSYAIIFMLVYYLTLWVSRSRQRALAKVLPVAVISVFAIVTLTRSMYWGDAIQLSIAEQAHHPNSSRANIMLGITYGALAEARDEQKNQYYLLASKLFEKESKLAPNNTNGLFQLILFSSILDLPSDPEWETTLTDRLENERFLVNNVNLISAMVSCQIEGRCSLADRTVLNIIQSALKNPAAKNSISAEIYTAASKYALVHQKDPQSALFLIAQATEAKPEEPRYRIHLARLLLALGRTGDATAELDNAEFHDSTGKETTTIANLRSDIRAASNMRPESYTD